MPREMDLDNCPKYLKDFIFYLRVVRGRSERTVQEYYFDLRLFLRYVAADSALRRSGNLENVDISKVSLDTLENFSLSDIYAFLNYLASSRKNGALARGRKVSAIKVFYHYLSTNARLISKDPMKDLELPSAKKSLPKYLTLEQSLELLKGVPEADMPRNYCIITLFLNCGMRLSELVGLNLQDVKLEERTMRLLGKGNKERIIYLNEACIQGIKGYLAQRPTVSSEPDAFFLSKQFRRISKRRVQQIVEECLKSAGLDKQGFSTHKLRHTAATLMYQYGHVDTLVLRDVLGHESIATTEIYTHLSSKQLKEAAESSPLAKVNMVKEKDK